MATKPQGTSTPHAKGPVELVLVVVMHLFYVTFASCFVGLVIEIAGSYYFWKDQGANHARELVLQDLHYIAAAPRSLLVEDTVAFSESVREWVALPFSKIGLVDGNAQSPAPNSVQRLPESTASRATGLRGQIRAASAEVSKTVGTWAVMTMYVTQDVLLRMCVAIFALPAFALACLVGVVDGLVRRDLRRWGGGRESSFVYHHAKRYTHWALTGGFGLYLAWPFGGFNPALMVLVFTVLTAMTLSTTVAAFKKYV